MTGNSIPVTAATGTGASESVFESVGLKAGVENLVAETQALYRADGVPWVIGYSGGKDSTAVLQVVWMALAAMPEADRTKPVHVITNDTLVENPVVAAWVNRSLDQIAEQAAEQRLPITPHRLTPEVSETFWVNIIGRGYPAPTRKFRWCTERMKINPSTRFIRQVVREDGEVILFLGARKAESAGRAARIRKWDEESVRDRLSPHNDLPSALVHKPIVDWTNDDVWMFLLQFKNPWGYDNKALMTMYRTASSDSECPVVVDTSTASCGNSRFGCWTCTVVDKDKSMAAMIQNDAEKEWMQPLLDIRDEIGDAATGKDMRDFRRLRGHVSLFKGNNVQGPYVQEARAHWLRRVLEAQRWVRDNGPDDVRDLELISTAELHEIRRIWVSEKHEYEDLLPVIYEDATGEPFPGEGLDDQFPFGQEDLAILREEATSPLQYELLRELVAVEHSHRAQVRRSGIWDDLAKAFSRSGYESPEEAINLAKARTRSRDAVASGDREAAFEEVLADVTAGLPGDETS